MKEKVIRKGGDYSSINSNDENTVPSNMLITPVQSVETSSIQSFSSTDNNSIDRQQRTMSPVLCSTLCSSWDDFGHNGSFQMNLSNTPLSVQGTSCDGLALFDMDNASYIELQPCQFNVDDQPQSINNECPDEFDRGVADIEPTAITARMIVLVYYHFNS